jgi:phosphoglycolate phosphatase
MHLFFDLDGTLIDSQQGVVRSIEYALTELGVPVPPAHELTQCIGPPLPVSLVSLMGTPDEERIELAMAAYRRRYGSVGIFENTVYPGIDRALAELAADGFVLSVVTAKPLFYARQILAHLDLANWFRAVYGPDLDERGYSKGSLIREACVAQDILGSEATMIGDRAQDILAGRENGLRTVGVLWGYGAREELETARPDGLVDSADGLLECVRSRT